MHGEPCCNEHLRVFKLVLHLSCCILLHCHVGLPCKRKGCSNVQHKDTAASLSTNWIFSSHSFQKAFFNSLHDSPLEMHDTVVPESTINVSVLQELKFSKSKPVALLRYFTKCPTPNQCNYSGSTKCCYVNSV